MAKKQKRIVKLDIRLTEKESMQLKKYAMAQGCTLSEYVRLVLFGNNTPCPEIKEAIAYTDGSYSDTLGVYSYGCIIQYNGEEYELYGIGKDEDQISMRNVAGEILAAIKAIQWAFNNDIDELTIYYDYLGIEMWADGKWATNKDATKRYKKYVETARTRINIKFVKVQAHSGIYLNEKVDALAKKAIQAYKP